MSLVVTSSSRSTNALPPLRWSRATAGGVATAGGDGRSRRRERSCSSAALVGGAAVAERERGLGARDQARQLGRVGVLVAGDGARGEHDVVQPVGDEAAGRLVVARLRAALQQQRRGGRGAAGDGDQVAREAPLAALERVALARRRARAIAPVTAWRPERAHDGRAAQQLDPRRLDARGERAAAGVGPQVGDGDDAHARGVQRERGVEPAVAGRGDDGGVARLDAVERGRGGARRRRASRPAGRCRGTRAAARACRSRRCGAPRGSGAACRPATRARARRRTRAPARG